MNSSDEFNKSNISEESEEDEEIYKDAIEYPIKDPVLSEIKLDIIEDNNLDLIKKLRGDISKNSIAIADIKTCENNDSIRSNDSNDSNELITPNSTDSINSTNSSVDINHEKGGKKKKKRKKRLFPNYVYSNIFDESTDNEWTELKRYKFQKCLWKLKYNRIVSTFYLDNLRRREQRWSWMIIVISTLTSGLTVANNVEDEPIKDYNTYINALLTISSMSTSLIAAWIKKQMFIEKINETDKYLLNINSLCEELEIQFSLLNSDRISYVDFKKKFIPEITKFLTTNPMISPSDWKSCIREITLKYPELVDPDNTEANKLWPWYGDLVHDTDDYNNESEVRNPTTFMKHFKKTHTDRIKSTCCFKSKNIHNIY